MNQGSAAGGGDALMSEAHAEDRRRGRELAYDPDRDPRLQRRAGARREDDVRGPDARDVVDAQLIVAHDADVFAELLEIPREVEDERVVVVDEEDHGAPVIGFGGRTGRPYGDRPVAANASP